MTNFYTQLYINYFVSFKWPEKPFLKVGRLSLRITASITIHTELFIITRKVGELENITITSKT